MCIVRGLVVYETSREDVPGTSAHALTLSLKKVFLFIIKKNKLSIKS